MTEVRTLLRQPPKSVEELSATFATLTASIAPERYSGLYSSRRVNLGLGNTLGWRRDLFQLVADITGCNVLFETGKPRGRSAAFVGGRLDAIGDTRRIYAYLRDGILQLAQQEYEAHVAEIEAWNQRHGGVWVSTAPGEEGRRISLDREPEHAPRFYRAYCDAVYNALLNVLHDPNNVAPLQEAALLP